MTTFVLMNEQGSVIHSTSNKAEAFSLSEKTGHIVNIVYTDDFLFAEIQAKIAHMYRSEEEEIKVIH